jgi:ActR/RegA family two-component response regulator
MGARILVVNDNKQVKTYLSRILSKVGGFSVEVAETGGEALQKIETAVFDLALVDLKLPDMEGLQLITDIVNAKPQILTVLITGHGNIQSAVEATKRGASDYLIKPFDLDDMIARLRKVLFGEKSFLNIENYPQKCLFGWEKIKEMKDNRNEFWAGDRFTRLRIVDVGRRDRSICMITREGNKTWPLDFQKLEGAHNRIHCQDKALLAHEIDRYIPTWGNYIWGLLEYLGCNKVLIRRSIFLDDALEDRRSFPSYA